jgi:hypothetical protein
MDPLAMNFDALADIDDGGCRYPGCTYEGASNYDPDSNWDDGSCNFIGCTNSEADNYDPNATEDDGSCEFGGCIDTLANNYDSTANVDDGSCIYSEAVMSVDFMSGCVPLTITVNNQTDVGDNGVCVFDLGDSNTHNGCEDSFEHIYESPGEYYIFYSYTVGEFESDIQIGPITVYNNPSTPEISYDLENNLISCDCPETWTINWYLDGELLPYSTPSWTPIDNGLYTVEVIDPNGCSAISDELGVIIVGVEEFSGYDEFLVYPNPAKDWIRIVTPCSGSQALIYAIDGTLVSSFRLDSKDSQVITPNLSVGLYSILVVCADQMWSETLVIRP